MRLITVYTCDMMPGPRTDPDKSGGVDAVCDAGDRCAPERVEAIVVVID